MAHFTTENLFNKCTEYQFLFLFPSLLLIRTLQLQMLFILIPVDWLNYEASGNSARHQTQSNLLSNKPPQLLAPSLLQFTSPYLSRINAGRWLESSFSFADTAGDQGRKAERRWRGWTQPMLWEKEGKEKWVNTNILLKILITKGH